MALGCDVILKPVWVRGKRLYEVMEDIKFFNSYGVFLVPKGFITDLASIPPIFRPFLPHDGKYLEAAILHDWLYRVASVSRKHADKIFLEEMIHLGVGYLTRTIVYQAVDKFGWTSYKKLPVSINLKKGEKTNFSLLF